jgi:hypothetical protein
LNYIHCWYCGGNVILQCNTWPIKWRPDACAGLRLGHNFLQLLIFTGRVTIYLILSNAKRPQGLPSSFARLFLCRSSTSVLKHYGYEPHSPNHTIADTNDAFKLRLEYVSAESWLPLIFAADGNYSSSVIQLGSYV